MYDYIELNKKNTEILINKGIKDPSRYERLKKNRYSIQLDMLSKYITKEAYLLDIGIREGAFIEFLMENGYTNLYGIDIYERSIDIARDKGIKCEIMDAQHLDLLFKFDVVVMSHVLEHCPNPDRVLSNVYNHLNNNGVLFIEVPIELGAPKPTKKDAHYYNFHSFNDLLKLLGDKWFVLEKFVSKKRIKVVLRRI